MQGGLLEPECETVAVLGGSMVVSARAKLRHPNPDVTGIWEIEETSNEAVEQRSGGGQDADFGRSV
jgi:hypothetical protein